MPKIRSIHPDACDSPKLEQLSDGAERTLWRLVTLADDEGRAVDSPRLLAAKLYPLHDDKTAEVLDSHLDELVQAGMLVRYQVAGKRFLQVHDFTDWQKPKYRSASKYPAPDDADPDPSPEPATPDPVAPGSSPDQGQTDPTASPDVPHGEGVGVGDGEGVERPSRPKRDSDPPDDQFDQFWERYPRGKGGKPGGDGAKKPARQRWRRLTDLQRHAAMRAVDNYRLHVESPEGPYAAHAVTWLNQERWDDWQDPASNTSDPSQRPCRVCGNTLGPSGHPECGVIVRAG